MPANATVIQIWETTPGNPGSPVPPVKPTTASTGMRLKNPIHRVSTRSRRLTQATAPAATVMPNHPM